MPAPTRRDFLGRAAAVLPGLAAMGTERRRPNIVVILIDDLGRNDIRCYGSTFHDTPNIDRLAAQGVRFTDGYAACPVCSPTRASIMTGKYPARLHVTDWIPGRRQWPAAKLLTPRFEQQLPLAETTIAEALKPLGYVSASIGKWHLGSAPYYPEHQGFDINIGGTDRGSPPSYFAPFRIPGLEARSPDDHLDDNLTARAEQFIESNKDRPFFLYLAHFAVHIPLMGKPDLVARYKRRVEAGETQNHPVYAAMVESMDASVGRVMAALDRLKLADDTAVLFLSDNGGLIYEGSRKEHVTWNAPLRAGKGHLYEGGIRIPMVVRWPGKIRAGATDSTPVSTIDLFPTIMEMAGGGTVAGSVDGVSMLPAPGGKGVLRRDALYWHYPHYSNQGGAPGGAVRQGDWKLIEFYEDHRLELYDLRNDAGERNNLAAKIPGRAARLHSMLREWRRRVNAAMPTANPNYDPEKADQGLTGARL